MKATGGKAIYGASVGILMLDARFPRIPGDMGNALTWPFPVHYRVVRSASPNRVVRQGAAGLLDTFIAAARELGDLFDRTLDCLRQHFGIDHTMILMFDEVAEEPIPDHLLRLLKDLDRNGET